MPRQLPVELLNHIWSFVGANPHAKLIKDVFENSYKSCDDVWDEMYTHLEMDFKNWYFDWGLYDVLKETARLNSLFLGKYRTKLFDPEFYNIEVLQIGVGSCDRCCEYLDWIAVQNYNGLCETCYAKQHGIGDDLL
jgi:hypothetical protein